MPSPTAAFIAREQSRWLRHDAARWVRPDAARFLAPGADLIAAYPALARKYNPNQPRVPKGSGDESGQWTSGDTARLVQPMGDINVVLESDTEGSENLVELAQIDKSVLDADGLPYYARGGHHEIPKGVYEKWNLQPETRQVFNGSTTGTLPSGKLVEGPEGPIRGHYWDGPNGAHDNYSKAVRDFGERFMQERGIAQETMTPEQAKELRAAVRNTDEPTIRNYNRGIRELRRIYRSFRGRE